MRHCEIVVIKNPFVIQEGTQIMFSLKNTYFGRAQKGIEFEYRSWPTPNQHVVHFEEKTYET